jgi:inner membrane protein involved in colicin E2 resistance
MRKGKLTLYISLFIEMTIVFSIFSGRKAYQFSLKSGCRNDFFGGDLLPQAKLMIIF